MRYVPLIGRILFTAIFLTSVSVNFSEQGIAYADAAGVPFPQVAVPLAGFLSLAGALSVLLGYRARGGAWLLVAFLVPVTLLMHAFWTVEDPATALMQQAMFLKNLSILGGALLIAWFGAGPISLDVRLAARPRTAPERMAA
ncbi:MAG TPA: DoxX family protein [Thermoanaerobaculia bacterium]